MNSPAVARALAERHRPLALYLAGLWLRTRPDAPADDVCSDAMVGLMEACYRYDDSRGFKFSTIANYWIYKAIREAAMRRMVDGRECEINGWDPAEPHPGDPDESMIREKIRGVVRSLPEPYRGVIEMRFGLGGPERTLSWIGARMGRSRERVRQIQIEALHMLRRKRACRELGR